MKKPFENYSPFGYGRPNDEREEVSRLPQIELSPRQRWEQYVSDMESLEEELEEITALEDKEHFQESVEDDLGRLVVIAYHVQPDLQTRDIDARVAAFSRELGKEPTIFEGQRKPSRPKFDGPGTAIKD